MKKIKLFLLLVFTAAIGMGTVRAQTVDSNPCVGAILEFPPLGSHQLKEIPPDTCISDSSDSWRLRWSREITDPDGTKENNGLLQLYQVNTGDQLWCAGISTGSCTQGKSLCLNSNGQLQMYSDSGCTGSKVFTAGPDDGSANQDGMEGLLVLGGKARIIGAIVSPDLPIAVWERP